jgi:hypothetical protein
MQLLNTKSKQQYKQGRREAKMDLFQNFNSFQMQGCPDEIGCEYLPQENTHETP